MDRKLPRKQPWSSYSSSGGEKKSENHREGSKLAVLCVFPNLLAFRKWRRHNLNHVVLFCLPYLQTLQLVNPAEFELKCLCNLLLTVALHVSDSIHQVFQGGKNQIKSHWRCRHLKKTQICYSWCYRVKQQHYWTASGVCSFSNNWQNRFLSFLRSR